MVCVPEWKQCGGVHNYMVGCSGVYQHVRGVVTWYSLSRILNPSLFTIVKQ